MTGEAATSAAVMSRGRCAMGLCIALRRFRAAMAAKSAAVAPVSAMKASAESA